MRDHGPGPSGWLHSCPQPSSWNSCHSLKKWEAQVTGHNTSDEMNMMQFNWSHIYKKSNYWCDACLQNTATSAGNNETFHWHFTHGHWMLLLPRILIEGFHISLLNCCFTSLSALKKMQFGQFSKRDSMFKKERVLGQYCLLISSQSWFLITEKKSEFLNSKLV